MKGEAARSARMAASRSASETNAVRTLKKGEYTKTPVPGPTGYHIILVEDARQFAPPGLNELKPLLLQGVIQQKTEKFIADLKTQATIK